MSQRFEKLLSPGTIGMMKLRNRIVMPAMIRGYSMTDGTVTRRLIDHYAARAKGGIGLAIIEASYVHPSGKIISQQLGIYDDKCIPGLSDLAGAVKEWGSKVAIQLHHAGRQTKTSITGMPIVAPSSMPCAVTGGLPVELSTNEVTDLIEAFAQAAKRAKQAGFDAVEIHGAHGYLINQFLSPNTNRRTDKFGGDINGRMTFLLEIMQRTKILVGNEFPIMVRLNGEDLVEGGLEFMECQQIAQKLQTVGVNALHITLGISEAALNPRRPRSLASMYEPRGHIVGYAEQIKKVVNLPVITVGSITPEMGEEILKQRGADFIAIGRGLLADPEIPNKLARDKPENIRQCIRCNEMCMRVELGIRCTVNPEVGYESYGITPAQKGKKVFIIGGGAAGMETARVSSLRGHDVTLFEKNGKLGGHLTEATVPNFKDDLRKYMDWLIREVQKLEVKIELNKEVTSQFIDDAKPDAIVIATGSTTYYPDIPGIDKPIVTTAIDILLGRAVPGNRTLILGGGVLGCETALYLAEQGKSVTIAEMLSAIAIDIPMIGRILAAKLVDNGVEILTDLKIIEITDNGVTAITQDKNVVHVKADKVVLAMGLKSQTKLYEELRGRIYEIYLAGDSVEPRRIGEATRDGFRIGCTI